MRVLPFYLAALLMTLACAYFDWRRGRVSNWITTPLLVAAPVAWALVAPRAGPFGLPGPLVFAGMSVVGASLCAAVPLLLFKLSMIGGADVKVLAALGALLLPNAGLAVELVAFTLAAVLSQVRLAYRGELLVTLSRTALLVVNPFRKPERRTAVPGALIERMRLCPFVLLAVACTTLVEGVMP
jgi:Flp pilus assembly protein protease CpaA